MNRLFFLFLIFPCLIHAQIVENWTDNDFFSQPIWQGNLDKFSIDPHLQLLYLNAEAVSSEAFICSPSEAINAASWSFSVNMDFNPSGSNYAKVYLTANQSAYTDDMEGYYVMIGNTSDEISLWKSKEGKNTKIIDGTDGSVNLSAVQVHIMAQRDDTGNWKLLSKADTEDFVLEGMVFDDEILTSQYFGIYCKYTSTRSNKFNFGPISISGEPYLDKESPRIISHQLISGNQINIQFNEPLKISSVKNENFWIDPLHIIPEKTVADNHQIDITFDRYLPDNHFGEITIQGIEDLSGNALKDTTLSYSFTQIKLTDAYISSQNTLQLHFSEKIKTTELSSNKIQETSRNLTFQEVNLLNDSIIQLSSVPIFKPDTKYEISISNIKSDFGDTIKDTLIFVTYRKPQRYDIVISEIMIDPSPKIGLTEAEYIEIYNRRAYPINLEKWILVINEKETTLPKYELPANAYVVLFKRNDANLWDAEIPLLPLNTLPALTNSSGTIILYNSNNQVCDALSYPFGNMPDQYKSDGGWSMEKIDLNNLQSNYNWNYAINLDGGTPGTENSINAENPDKDSPFIKYISFINEHTFEYTFSEPMDTLGYGLNHSIEIKNTPVSSVTIEPIFLNKLKLTTTNNLTEQTIYRTSFTDTPKDLAGNSLLSTHSLRIGIPEDPDSFDIAMNEILFNPTAEGTDFIELYNRSDKIINRSDLYLSSMSSGVPDELMQVDDKNQILFPGDYLVVTEDSNKLSSINACIINEFLTQSNLPSLNDDEGNIALTKNTGEIIDYVEYTENMHFELLRDKEGVSLERINPNWPATNKSNWHSASSPSGFCTPTQQNSQYSSLIPLTNNKWIWLEKEEFSPNSDGNEDYLQINYQLPQPGWSGTIKAFDKFGRPVKTICNNDLLSTEGFYSWDGTTDHHTKASIGIYLIFSEFFSETGEVKKEKLVAVLTAGDKR